MDRPPDRYPSPEEVSERIEALKRCLSADNFYANYGLVEPGGEFPADEPMELVGYACVYPPEPDKAIGTYMLVGGSDRLPPRAELRRKILGFEVRPGTLDSQQPTVRAWRNPLGRLALSGQAYEAARGEEAPVCFIAFGRTAEERLIAFIAHRPEIPSDVALDMIRESVEGAMAQRE